MLRKTRLRKPSTRYYQNDDDDDDDNAVSLRSELEGETGPSVSVGDEMLFLKKGTCA